jgi:uncharacterized protein YjiS (DUF1127 family)
MKMQSPRSRYVMQSRVAYARLPLRWVSYLVAALQRLRSVIEEERRARRAIIELERLDDRMLRDIGIDRSEIDRAVRGTRAMRTYWHEG